MDLWKRIKRCFQDEEYKKPCTKKLRQIQIHTSALFYTRIRHRRHRSGNMWLTTQSSLYNYSFLSSAKSQNNTNRESSVPKHKKGRIDYHLLHLCQPKTKAHTLLASLSSKQLPFCYLYEWSFNAIIMLKKINQNQQEVMYRTSAGWLPLQALLFYESHVHPLKDNLYHPHCHKYFQSPHGEIQLLAVDEALKKLQLF